MHLLKTTQSHAAMAGVLLSSFLLSSPRTSAGSGAIVFHDVPSQARQFMRWNDTITLNARQEAVRMAALSQIPAPCCSDNTAYTCCCQCNMARTIWGLSKHMIAEQGADAKAVTAKVREWIHYVNPKGSSGRACYTGGCGRPFREDGCGGMKRESPVF